MKSTAVFLVMLDCFALLPGVPLLKVAARAEQLDVPQGVATAARERPAMVEMERLDCPAAASASPTEAFGDRLATIRRPPVPNGRLTESLPLSLLLAHLLVLIQLPVVSTDPTDDSSGVLWQETPPGHFP